MKKTVISLFLSVILTASSFAAISPVLRYCNAGTFDLWTEEAYYCSPVVTDLDGDGENDSLVPMTQEEYISDYLYPNAVKSEDYPHTVKDGCVFVLGDNRTCSLDSRYVGDIDERKILGKAYVRLFPFTQFKLFF